MPAAFVFGIRRPPHPSRLGNHKTDLKDIDCTYRQLFCHENSTMLFVAPAFHGHIARERIVLPHYDNTESDLFHV